MKQGDIPDLESKPENSSSGNKNNPQEGSCRPLMLQVSSKGERISYFLNSEEFEEVRRSHKASRGIVFVEDSNIKAKQTKERLDGIQVGNRLFSSKEFLDEKYLVVPKYSYISNLTISSNDSLGMMTSNMSCSIDRSRMCLEPENIDKLFKDSIQNGCLHQDEIELPEAVSVKNTSNPFGKCCIKKNKLYQMEKGTEDQCKTLSTPNYKRTTARALDVGNPQVKVKPKQSRKKSIYEDVIPEHLKEHFEPVFRTNTLNYDDSSWDTEGSSCSNEFNKRTKKAISTIMCKTTKKRRSKKKHKKPLRMGKRASLPAIPLRQGYSRCKDSGINSSERRQVVKSFVEESRVSRLPSLLSWSNYLFMGSFIFLLQWFLWAVDFNKT